MGPDVTGDDSQLVLHDLTSAVPFAPRSFISNEGTTFAPSSSQQHRRLSVAIPNQVRTAVHAQCCTATATPLYHTASNALQPPQQQQQQPPTTCTATRGSAHTSAPPLETHACDCICKACCEK
jgi:hypothetical protein